MEMNGERLIAAPKQDAWDALFNPDVLRQCIPGCESVERLSETSFKAAITLAVGPVKAKFSGEAMMSEISAPDSCKLTGKGNGGIAGFGKGDAWVRFSAVEGGTLLNYQVKGSVGGKLAQVGQRLIDSTAEKFADEFFTAFARVLESQAALRAAVPDPKAEAASSQGWHTSASSAGASLTPAPEVLSARPRVAAWWPFAVASVVAAGALFLMWQ